MTPDKTPGRIKKLLIFSLILLIMAGLLSFLIIMLWQKEDNATQVKTEGQVQPVERSANIGLLLAGNDLLASRLNALQQLDQQFTDQLTKPNNKKKLDTIQLRIVSQEAGFRGAIDSIFLNTPYQDDTIVNKLFTNIIASYRSILDNRPSIGGLRNVLNRDRKDIKPDELAVINLQNELAEKDSRIASLESALKSMPANTPGQLQGSEKEMATIENVAQLKEDIKKQENRIAALTILSNNLKQDNERLVKQQGDAAKPGTGDDDARAKARYSELQQKIDELNAELRLARVDCNLSRVDASQIISNSRQRKELLSEASGILTTLAQSDDATIRKKVQDKISRLNQVAATTRD